MLKLLTIKIALGLFLVSCGQENIQNTLQKIEDEFGEVRVVIVDEANNQDSESEVPYYHEVNDTNTGTETNTDTSSQENTNIGSTNDSENETGSTNETTGNQGGESETTEQKVTFSEIKDAYIYRDISGKINFTKNQSAIYFSSISETAKDTLNNITFPNDSYKVTLTYSNSSSKSNEISTSIIFKKLESIKIEEEASNPGRTELENEFEAFYCGKIYIDQNPIVKDTKPIYIENISDSKIYRIHNSGLYSHSLLKHYELFTILSTIETQEVNGCIYTNDDYYFNYELPEYRRIINVDSFSIGW